MNFRITSILIHLSTYNRKGYAVKAAVRDQKNEQKIKHLKREDVTLVTVPDLQKDEGFE
jgi:hypothetical protein